MKNTLILSSLCAVFSITGAYAQETTEQADQKTVRKEVQVSEENGVMTVNIVTDINGTRTIETYTGVEADKKLKELEANADAETKSEEKKVIFEEKDGKKILTVKTNVNGKETVEVYEGEEAENKLKEIQSEESSTEPKVQKKIIKEEVKKEKADM